MRQKRDFEKAREAMIDSQIHPMGVVSEAILNAFSKVPREEFVPEDKRGVCYCDEDIEIAPGRYLMEPSVLARLVQAADVKKDEAVLTIGSGAGYNASILSYLASTVVALEENELLFSQAQSGWDKLGYCNIAAIKGSLIDGVPDTAPYNCIIFNGAVSKVPDNIRQQLSVGGRMAVIVKETGKPIGKAMLIERNSENVYGERVLFDAGTPYLHGFEPKKEFVF